MSGMYPHYAPTYSPPPMQSCAPIVSLQPEPRARALSFRTDDLSQWLTEPAHEVAQRAQEAKRREEALKETLLRQQAVQEKAQQELAQQQQWLELEARRADELRRSQRAAQLREEAALVQQQQQQQRQLQQQPQQQVVPQQPQATPLATFDAKLRTASNTVYVVNNLLDLIEELQRALAGGAGWQDALPSAAKALLKILQFIPGIPALLGGVGLAAVDLRAGRYWSSALNLLSGLVQVGPVRALLGSAFARLTSACPSLYAYIAKYGGQILENTQRLLSTIAVSSGVPQLASRLWNLVGGDVQAMLKSAADFVANGALADWARAFARGVDCLSDLVTCGRGVRATIRDAWEWCAPGRRFLWGLTRAVQLFPSALVARMIQGEQEDR